ncbi:hypothetical protein [Neisseria iguanae]|uniref:Uncharacterized protein n=1 Tax=Neisseria iguanae TaxID=90242 RepID=A0A2P7U2N7_9NEIS|nr:hypothetical protein [Neisseria iguanae]PSJ81238.1 hypothetical protein C7N83_01445 [Neisseria iguanae]
MIAILLLLYWALVFGGIGVALGLLFGELNRRYGLFRSWWQLAVYFCCWLGLMVFFYQDEVQGRWEFNKICGEVSITYIAEEKIRGSKVKHVYIDTMYLKNTVLPIQKFQYGYEDIKTGDIILKLDSFLLKGGRMSSILLSKSPVLMSNMDDNCNEMTKKFDAEMQKKYGFLIVN